MRGLLALADVLLMSRALGDNLPIVQKSKIPHKLLLVSGFFLAVGMVFIVYAVHVAVMKTYSSEAAAAATGSIMVAIALLCALGSYIADRIKHQKIQKVKDDITNAILMALDTVEDTVTTPVKDSPKTSVASAAVAGFLAGEALL